MIHTYASKLLADGRLGEVIPLTFGRARIIVRKNADAITLDESGW
jgi:hypothetical protein